MKQLFHIDGGVWAHRDVRLILPARTLALAGNAMAIVTLLLQAHDRGVGTLGVAVLLVCLSLPAIATMGVVGRLADTHDSRTLLLLGVGVQVIALVVLAFSPSVPVTLVGVVLLELGQAVIGPVWSGLLPRVVGQQAIGSVIAWQQGLGSVAAPIGAALGGVLYGTSGATTSLLVAAVGFAALWCVIPLIRTRRHLAVETRDPTTPPPPVRSGILTGVEVLRRDRVVWPTFLALIPMVVMVEGTNAVEVFLARDTLGASPEQYGLGELFAGVGGVAGAAIAGRFAGTRSWVTGTIGGFAVACAALALSGAAPSYWVYLGLIVIVAAAAGIGNASNGALVMTRTDDSQRGTVGAALSGIARTGSVLALGLGGLVGALVSPRAVFIGGGLLGMAAVLVCGWPSVRAARREKIEPPAPATA